MLYLETVDSTNLYIKRQIAAGAALPDGYAVMADGQTAGRGQQGKTFYSPAGGLYMSVLYRPELAPADAPFLTVCAAVAVCRALSETGGFEAAIKPANDIFYGGKKLGGILIETEIAADELQYAVVGIGLNLRGVPPEVRDTAVSAADIAGKQTDRTRLAAAVRRHLETCLKQFLKEGKEALQKEYNGRVWTK